MLEILAWCVTGLLGGACVYAFEMAYREHGKARVRRVVATEKGWRVR